MVTLRNVNPFLKKVVLYAYENWTIILFYSNLII